MNWRTLVLMIGLLLATEAFAETELELGMAEFKAKRFEAALPHLLAAKSDVKGAFYLGRTYFELQRFDEALTTLQTVVKLDPKNPEAWGELGILQLNRHALVPALNAFKKSLALRPTPNAHYELGRVYEAQGKLQLAIDSCEKSRALLDSAQANACLGSTHMNHGEIEAGLRFFTHAIELDKDNPLRHFEMGIALAQASRMSDAAASLETALKLSPNYANAHFQLGRVMITQGRYAEALPHMKKADELGQAGAKEFVEKLNQLLAAGATP